MKASRYLSLWTKGAATAAALALVALAQPASAQAVRTDTAGGPTTTLGVQPVYYNGNLTCQSFIEPGTSLIEFKADVPGKLNPAPDPEFKNGTFDLEQGAQLTISDFDGKYFDFSISKGVVQYVFVKAGNGGNLFTYDPPATTDTGLHGPVASNGRVRDVSHVSFCWRPDDEQGDKETAFAFGGGTNAADGDDTTCFLNVPAPGFGASRWGWTMGPLSEDYAGTWNVYAGAGQCNVSKGALVGELAVTYEGGYVTLQFTPGSSVTVHEDHVWVGHTPGPEKCNPKGCSYDPAPGGYGSSLTDSPIAAEGDIYVIFHAVVSY